MRTLYYDSKFKCHTTNPDGIFQEFETDFFDGKCDMFVEGYIHLPDGEKLVWKDGKTLTGRRNFPWRPYPELAAAQAQYERDMAELAAAYQEGVNSV